MFFSIIIPVYNVEKYIDKCLQSVVTQDFDSFEVILVDDGSTDSSGRQCDAYGKKHSNVKIIHQENKGLSGARNAGLEVAEGDWILFVDSDDWIESGMLNRLYEQMTAEDADLYSFNVYKTDEQENITEKMIFASENSSVLFSNEKGRFEYITEQFMQYKTGWEACSRVFRRSLIEKNNLRFQDCAEVFAEDYLFTFQYLLYVKKVRQLCSLLYYYRQRKGSLIHSVVMSSVLGRLYRWAEYAVDRIKKENLVYFRKSFPVIYFRLLNHHLQYMLSDVPQEEVKKELRLLQKNRLHRKWMKQLRMQKDELWKDMRRIKWI